eukprot:COSAG02_NODE_6725_length_3398_cov_79.417399_2_plen_402_part_00
MPPPGCTPGAFVHAIVCPLRDGHSVVQMLWPGMLKGVDGSVVLREACVGKAFDWRRGKRQAGPAGHPDWAAILTMSDDVLRNTTGVNKDGDPVLAPQAAMPCPLVAPEKCAVPVVCVHKAPVDGAWTTLVGAGTVVNPTHSYKPGESFQRESKYVKNHTALLSSKGSAFADVMLLSASVHLLSAKVQAHLQLGDVEQAQATLHGYSHAYHHTGDRAKALLMQQVERSITLNVDPVCMHHDASKDGQPLYEAEVLMNVAPSVDATTAAGLGAPAAEEVKVEWRSQEGMIFLPEYGVFIDNMPDSDMLFCDFNDILHCVAPPAAPSLLRGHWSVDGPVIGIADHRSGFRLGVDVATQWRAARADAWAWGHHATAVVARQQALQYVELYSNHMASKKARKSQNI